MGLCIFSPQSSAIQYCRILYTLVIVIGTFPYDMCAVATSWSPDQHRLWSFQWGGCMTFRQFFRLGTGTIFAHVSLVVLSAEEEKKLVDTLCERFCGSVFPSCVISVVDWCLDNGYLKTLDVSGPALKHICSCCLVDTRVYVFDVFVNSVNPRVCTLAWLKWCTYDRCLRNNLKCQFVQTELIKVSLILLT